MIVCPSVSCRSSSCARSIFWVMEPSVLVMPPTGAWLPAGGVRPAMGRAEGAEGATVSVPPTSETPMRFLRAMAYFLPQTERSSASISLLTCVSESMARS